MSSTSIPRDRAELRRALRQKAGELLGRYYRHEALVARAVRGLQLEAVAEFRREIAEPLLREVGGRLATIDGRGPNVTPDTDPALRALVDEAERIIERGTDSIRKLAEDRLQRLGRSEAEWASETAAKAAKQDVPPAQTDAAVRDRYWLGDKTEQWFEKMLGGPTASVVRKQILEGIQAGQSTDEIVRGLRGTAGQTGALDAPQRSVAMLVRTAAAAASSSSRIASFQALGATHYMWVSTLDSKTSLICAERDSKVFEVGKGPLPPAHPNCRSTIVPTWDPDEKLEGDRASVDGPVPASTTFAQWLKDQPEADQDEVLGKTKAAAWRAGKLSIEKMLGDDAEPLTLQELRRLDRL